MSDETPKVGPVVVNAHASRAVAATTELEGAAQDVRARAITEAILAVAYEIRETREALLAKWEEGERDTRSLIADIVWDE